MLTVATTTGTSESEYDGGALIGMAPYYRQGHSYSYETAIDDTTHFSSSGSGEEDWQWRYPEGGWDGSGTAEWDTASFLALDLRGPWFLYPSSQGSGTATEDPYHWTYQSTPEFGTSHAGVLSTGTPALYPSSWARDRQGNAAFSLNLNGTSTWLNRLNSQDLGTLTELTGQIPGIGIR